MISGLTVCARHQLRHPGTFASYEFWGDVFRSAGTNPAQNMTDILRKKEKECEFSRILWYCLAMPYTWRRDGEGVTGAVKRWERDARAAEPVAESGAAERNRAAARFMAGTPESTLSPSSQSCQRQESHHPGLKITPPASFRRRELPPRLHLLFVSVCECFSRMPVSILQRELCSR